MEEYFRVRDDVLRLASELERAAAQAGGMASAEVTGLEDELKRVMARRNGLRNDVEETLEATISAVIVREGLSTWGEFIFPPVDVRLAETPKLLVTSPRDRILRTHDVLLRPGVDIGQREEMEDTLMKESNLSALVTDIGGVATYPASIPSTQPLHWTLQIAAHEWLHHYLFFRPLGQNMFKSGDMQSLNETVANIAGNEMGDRAFEMFGGTIDKPSAASQGSVVEELSGDGGKEEEFDFRAEMQRTRVRTDELLAEGKIEEAEAYMEERRKLIVENGFHLRKLNQAFFAFNGTYADSPASISPIADQLHEFKALMPDLGSFIRTIAAISSYRQFLDELEERKAAAGPP